MEEKLPPPKENLSEPQEESHIEAPKNPVEKNPLSKEKDFNDKAYDKFLNYGGLASEIEKLYVHDRKKGKK